MVKEAPGTDSVAREDCPRSSSIVLYRPPPLHTLTLTTNIVSELLCDSESCVKLHVSRLPPVLHSAFPMFWWRPAIQVFRRSMNPTLLPTLFVCTLRLSLDSIARCSTYHRYDTFVAFGDSSMYPRFIRNPRLTPNYLTPGLPIAQGDNKVAVPQHSNPRSATSETIVSDDGQPRRRRE